MVYARPCLVAMQKEKNETKVLQYLFDKIIEKIIKISPVR